MKKIIGIFGGSGLIGTSIISNKDFNEYFFYIYTRSDSLSINNVSSHNNLRIIQYDGNDKNIEELKDCEIIINLAGASIAGKRWTKKYKKILYDSRIETTKNIIESIRQKDTKLKTLINISATGIYGFRKDEELDENAQPGNDFLANLCIDWEKEALKANDKGIKTVILRTGIVLSRNGGALKKLLVPYRYFIGGYQGNGNQWMPWIHIKDLISIIKGSIIDRDLDGIINCVSPEPITNKEFSKTIGKIMKRPSIFPVPGLILRILLGEFATSILKGQKVLPQRLLDLNFKFKFANLNDALRNLLLI
jgi:uncharacterized protein (TIGR01777 family)